MMNEVIEVKDYIGDPSQRCEKHGQSFYFHCWRCFTGQHTPVALAVKKKGRK
jgi:hypothetical protein